MLLQQHARSASMSSLPGSPCHHVARQLCRSAGLIHGCALQIVRGSDVLNSEVVKGLLAHLRTGISPHDDEAFQAASKAPPRRLGDAFWQGLREARDALFSTEGRVSAEGLWCRRCASFCCAGGAWAACMPPVGRGMCSCSGCKGSRR